MRRWLLAVAVIAGAGLIVVLAVGADPWRALAAAVASSVGSPDAVQETFAKTTPLLWCGLAVALAFRAGVWNIGAEGQLLAGATAATAVVLAVPVGPWSAPLGLLAGGLAGAAWAGIAAVLRLWRGVNEVLSTILLNLIAVAGVSWAVHGPLQEAAGTYPQSDAIPRAAWLWRPFPPGRAHLGFLLALAAAGLLTLALRRTGWGLEIRASGDAPETARVCGIRVERVQAGALVLSGLLAGLGGAVELTGVTHRLFERFSPGWGYSGIAVALLGGLQPGATAVAATLFGGLAAASGGLQRVAGVPTVATLLIQGLVIVVLAAGRRR
ncbi:MAG: ABC transporter permease [Acidobacteria bacterium]|jgi:simple sugar transport system permease protein|nr:ABC transporter permease [Acidobacteriota bacterium]